MIKLDPDDRVYAPGSSDPEPCAWFARCTNLAIGLEPHPVLGAVPICGRCHDRVEAMK